MVAAFNFPPRGFAACNGQLLPINQWQALFSLFGTTFGGDGRTTFGVPNLQGRSSLGFGGQYTMGERAGEEQHTLLSTEMPQHNHIWKATSAAGNNAEPANLALGAFAMYSPSSNSTMIPAELSNTGGSQPHENRSPFLVLNFCVCLSGIFPSRN
jgi:microcystin-dependent protein